MDALQDQAFAFGDFVLVPKERLLLCDGEPVPLTGKAFDLLVVLVRHSGHLVTKDELLQEVWPNTFVQETNLTVNISALRKVLGRGDNGNGIIQTVPGRGYRLVAPVVAREAAPASILRVESADNDLDAAPNSQPVAPIGAARHLGGVTHRGWAILAAAVVCVAIGAIALWRAQPENTNVPFGSVAVLPFASDSSGNNYLADGLTEAILNGLVQLQSLRVAPRASAFRFKGSAVGPKDAGLELGVAAVVTATISQQGTDLRIQVDLVDVALDSQIWGARYQGDVSELVHLQTRILQDLPRALRFPLSDQETRRIARPVTDDADAYRAYLQGRHEWGQRSEAALKRAIERFRHAVAIDPEFAAAYSGLADSYSILGYLSYLSPAETFPEAKRHATKALELDATLAEAHASLGFVKLYFEWDWVGAETAFQRAIALDPNHAASHQWYSIYLLAAGRPTEAFREIQFAQQRDPVSLPVNTDLGFYYYYTGQYEEAVKQLNFVLEMNPDFPPAHLWLGRAYQELGKFDEALSAFHRVEDRVRDWPVSIAARGFVAGAAGRPTLALQALTELEQLSSRRFVTSYGIALIHAGLGQDDEAFASLNKAFDERSNWLVWLRLDPRWNALRPDPRFTELVSRMRFPP
ncbi:tetratricopeptide repeat protein [Mesorhizobium waimense]|uniref:Tetratricopeptide repeat protein n=1 Tax=Mesorhizobium waimense TaxID=1300307 RepID=A0A3A5JZC6_9HYPH|nr:tetratricopeptide repeat protein [Mesorhizobium waimense]RJT28158.1 tetratricopeptide repeat protein [Mesorhizobium waimense]